MTLNGIMAVTLRYFTEVGRLNGKPALQKTICGGILQESNVFLVHVQCRRKESSRSLSHLLMSFLFLFPMCHSLQVTNYMYIKQKHHHNHYA